MLSKAIVVYKPVNECLTLTKRAVSTLRRSGIETDAISVDDLPYSRKNEVRYDLVISIGGDGTFLRSVHELVKDEDQLVYLYPCGRRNFFYEKPELPIEEALQNVLEGKHVVELIPVYRVSYENTHFPFLNDVVIVNSNLGKTGKYVVDISSSGLKSSYRVEGDGIIISTPYGSSGHNLSAGGPLVVPQLEALVLTHLSPMTLGFPSIVIPASAKVTVRVQGVFNLYSDGIYLKSLERGSTVEVTRDRGYIRVARINPCRDILDIVIKQRSHHAG
ncbi:MAG: hypothetical protein QXE77_02140 [Desulfurococcaceae archaeon]